MKCFSRPIFLSGIKSLAMLAMVCGLAVNADAQQPVIPNLPSNVSTSSTLASGVPVVGDYITIGSSSALNSGSNPAGVLDFATGTGGRGIGTVFAPQTLQAAGDFIQAEFTFVTPASVALDSEGGTATGTENTNEDIRFGLFDTSVTAGLPVVSQNNDTGAAVPDLLDFTSNIGVSSSTTQPVLNIPGIVGEFDNIQTPTNGGSGDLGIQVVDLAAATGRLLGTTDSLDNVSNNGGSGNVTIAPNTTYSALLRNELRADGDFDATITFFDAAGTILSTHTDIAPGTTGSGGAAAGVDTNTFDILAFQVSSEAFGLNASVGDADNGLDFTNVTITSLTTVAAIPEPSSLALLGLFGCAGFIRRRR